MTYLAAAYDAKLIEDARTLAACSNGSQILDWYEAHPVPGLTREDMAPNPYACAFGTLAALAGDLIAMAERA